MLVCSTFASGKYGLTGWRGSRISFFFECLLYPGYLFIFKNKKNCHDRTLTHASGFFKIINFRPAFIISMLADISKIQITWVSNKLSMHIFM